MRKTKMSGKDILKQGNLRHCNFTHKGLPYDHVLVEFYLHKTCVVGVFFCPSLHIARITLNSGKYYTKTTFFAINHILQGTDFRLGFDKNTSSWMIIKKSMHKTYPYEDFTMLEEWNSVVTVLEKVSRNMI